MRIVLTGGGTGGHIFPILAVVQEMRKKVGERDELELLFLGTDGELEKRVMDKENIPVKKVWAGKMRRYFSGYNILDLFVIPVGIVQALWHLFVFMPDAVFAKGGFASIPVSIAAWLYRIPILVHESDIMPGIANQFIAKLARRAVASFPGSEKFFPERKIILAGNPIRPELAAGEAAEARRIFSLSADKKTILVMGGSLGARAINQAIMKILPRLMKKYQLIHVTGVADYEGVLHEAGKLGIKAGREGYSPRPFLYDDLKHAMAVADLVISRAGANAMTEVAANGKPAIIVPISGSANNHQEQNAFAFSQAGAVVVLEQSNLGENILWEKIEEILENKELNFQLREKIKKFYNPKAAEIIAQEIINLAR